MRVLNHNMHPMSMRRFAYFIIGAICNKIAKLFKCGNLAGVSLWDRHQLAGIKI
jgi:hypothetical protein